jgi:hypothetical protein
MVYIKKNPITIVNSEQFLTNYFELCDNLCKIEGSYRAVVCKFNFSSKSMHIPTMKFITLNFQNNIQYLKYRIFNRNTNIH